MSAPIKTSELPIISATSFSDWAMVVIPDAANPGKFLTARLPMKSFTGNTQGSISPLGAGQTNVIVNFYEPFYLTPPVVTAVLEQGALTDDMIWVTGITNLTLTGFTAIFSSPITGANRKLHWTAYSRT